NASSRNSSATSPHSVRASRSRKLRRGSVTAGFNARSGPRMPQAAFGTEALDRRRILEPMPKPSPSPVIVALLALLPLARCGGAGDRPAAPAAGADCAAKATAACQAAAARKAAQGSFPDKDFDPRQPDVAKLAAVAAFIAEGGKIYASWLQAMQALGD